MKTKDFVLNCLRCYSSACKYMDELQDAFDIELEEDDILDALRVVSEQTKPELGNELITRLFDKIIDKAAEEYKNILREKFDYDAEDYCSGIYFGGTHVRSWDELCTAFDQWLETKNQK